MVIVFLAVAAGSFALTVLIAWLLIHA